MIDVLEPLHAATCKNCNGPLTFLRGSFSGGDWYHDDNGEKRCPGAPTAWPVESTIRDVDQEATA